MKNLVNFYSIPMATSPTLHSDIHLHFFFLLIKTIFYQF